MSDARQQDEVFYYGHAAWIGGLALAAFVAYLMFSMADGF